MRDGRKDALRVESDSRIKLEFHGAAVTSDAGLISMTVETTARPSSLKSVTRNRPDGPAPGPKIRSFRLDTAGGCYNRAPLAKRWSQAVVKWAMSVQRKTRHELCHDACHDRGLKSGGFPHAARSRSGACGSVGGVARLLLICSSNDFPIICFRLCLNPRSWSCHAGSSFVPWRGSLSWSRLWEQKKPR